MVGQRGPPGGCVAEDEPVVVGQVGAEPSGEVVGRPGVGEAGVEEGGGLLVELEEATPFEADSAVLLGPVRCAYSVGGVNRVVRAWFGPVGLGLVGFGQ